MGLLIIFFKKKINLLSYILNYLMIYKKSLRAV